MKEELYVFIDDERYQLDLTSPSGITLKWVSNLFNDISKLTCSHSYTFKLPITQNNRRVLKLTDDIRHNGGLERKVIPAEFYINGVCLCPNANLYVSELSDSISCVMTWRVLKGFETLKSNGGKLTDLNSLGTIQWGASEEYGGTDDTHSNMDAVLYPDYDAGMPHEADTPPKPCVPIYRLLQMIKERFGVKINIGSFIGAGLGLKGKGSLNNSAYYGRRVYDDYISNGVLPLVNSNAANEKYVVRGIHSIGAHTLRNVNHECTQKWQMYCYLYKTTYGSTVYDVLHYGIIEGQYVGLQRCEDDGVASATWFPALPLYVGIPILGDFRESEYIKKVYVHRHDTGLSLYKQKKGERVQVEAIISHYSGGEWQTRTYKGIEQVTDTWERTEQGSALNTTYECIEDTTSYLGIGTGQTGRIFTGGDSIKSIGICGFYTNQAFTLKGSCTLHITLRAANKGRININDYQWICLAKKMYDKEELEIVTDKDINSCIGFQSVDIPVYDSTTGTYVCHFDFGQNYEARKINVDECDDELFAAYVFLPYIPSDYTEDTYERDENGNYVLDGNGERKKNGEINVLSEGDIYFQSFVISEIVPKVESGILPIQINITQNLPEISCFDFVKSLFYMNGAMPRVESDGETISAMYYKQLRDRINDGIAIDWSDKLLSTSGDLASSVKYHNTNFSRDNYLEMAYSTREKTEDELLEELDQYGKGYGFIHVDDKTLQEERAIFKSPFYPAYEKNIRYPLIKTGRTFKVWEGDKTLVKNVPPIYGVINLRKLDSSFEDINITRPGLVDINKNHIRLDIFSPFDDENLMDDFFGYLKSILNNYVLVKEKFKLQEIDLREFDESMPVYLSKYNSFFAISSIQRDKEGICTVELLKLPRASEVKTSMLDLSYEVEIISTGMVTFDSGENDNSNVYIQRTPKGEWETTEERSIAFGSEGIYAITADNVSSENPVLRIYASAVGQYRYTYTDNESGERVSILRSEANIYYDGNLWSNGNGFEAINDGDGVWHSVEIEIPIRNELGIIVERRRWKSPFFVSGKSVIDFGENDTRYEWEYNYDNPLLSFLIQGVYDSQIGFENGSNGTGSISGRMYIPINQYIPKYLFRIKKTYSQYKLSCSVSRVFSYQLTKKVGYNIVFSQSMNVKLKVYCDEIRINGETTLTIPLEEYYGQYHIFKIIADIENENGDIIERFRRKIYWFGSDVDESVMTDDFGDEHDGDNSIKVNRVYITGPYILSDLNEYNYKLAFSPEYPDVDVSSVQVSSNADSGLLDISNVSKAGFTLQALSLPDVREIVDLTIRVTLEDESYFEETKQIGIQKPGIYFYFNGSENVRSFDALNGSGSITYKIVLFNNTEFTIHSITSSNGAITIQNITEDEFTLVAQDIVQDETTVVSVTVVVTGVEITRSIEVKALLKNIWSIETLDTEGALIIDRNGSFYTEAQWKASGILNEDADGVAVSDGTHRLIIAKNEFVGIIGGYWYEMVNGQRVEHGTLVSGQFTATNQDDASTDFNGIANTTAIIQQVQDTDVGLLRHTQQFPSGIQGYLGAVGEWLIVYQKRDKVKRLLEAIGASAMFDTRTSQSGGMLYFPQYWTSTQGNQYKEWSIMSQYSGYILGMETKKPQAGYGVLLRAFAEVRQISNPITRGSIAIQGADSFEATGGVGYEDYVINISPVGATISELTVTSDNLAVTISNVSNAGFRVSVNGVNIDHVANITVRARVNGLIESATKQVSVEVGLNMDRLDEEHALIIGKNYHLYSKEEWEESGLGINDMEGIAVSDGTHQFIMAAENANGSTLYYWGGGFDAFRIEGLGSGTSDFDGEGNTERIIETITGSDGYFTESPYSAAAVAKQYTFPSGSHGYLGSAGEWNIVNNYYGKIETLLEAIYGISLARETNYTYWTSSGSGGRFGATHVDVFNCQNRSGTVYRSFGKVDSDAKRCLIRAFRKIR